MDNAAMKQGCSKLFCETGEILPELSSLVPTYRRDLLGGRVLGSSVQWEHQSIHSSHRLSKKIGRTGSILGLLLLGKLLFFPFVLWPWKGEGNTSPPPTPHTLFKH